MARGAALRAGFVLKGPGIRSDEGYVVPRLTANGGFPEPPPGGVVRVVRAEHAACGRETRVRLPAHLPAGAVRRVVCQSCAQSYDAPSVEEVDVLEAAAAPAVETSDPAIQPAQPEKSPSRRLSLPLFPPLPPAPRMPSLPSLGGMPAWLRDPRSGGWRYLSIPVAAVAVIAGLMLIQGSDDSDIPFERAVPAANVPAEAGDAGRGAGKGGGAGGSADLVREASFSVALPSGWQRTNAAGGATFAAVSDTGDADATLWVERDPQLAFSEFEARSLDQLESLAGSARVVERVAAPTADATIVRLAADAPEGSPAYEVTLRASGPYRYYLSTTVQPDALREALEGAELVHGSFVPTGTDAEGQG